MFLFNLPVTGGPWGVRASGPVTGGPSCDRRADVRTSLAHRLKVKAVAQAYVTKKKTAKAA